MKNYRNATPEQKAAAKAKREKFYQLVKMVGEMSEEQRAEMAARLPVANCEGHPLSVFNNVLIASQFDNATIVGGFNQWKAAGRCVRKGEHGFAIFAPRTQGKAEVEPTELAKQPDHPSFIMVYVFDISQTDPIETGNCAEVEPVEG